MVMARELPNGQLILTYDEAVARLTVHEDEDGRRTVHAFLESPIALLGADWDEETVLALLREADAREDETERINETGPAAQGMRHGVAVWTKDKGMVFFAASGAEVRS
jgi:hypothetical protein